MKRITTLDKLPDTIDNKTWDLRIWNKINEIIDVLNAEKAGCDHIWEYSSPPHRDQRCKKCKEHRIEPEKKVSDPSAQLEDDIHSSYTAEKAERCPICEGLGWHWHEQAREECKKCNGSGKLSTSGISTVELIILIAKEIYGCKYSLLIPEEANKCKKLAHAIMEQIK
jgi:hypothetical protein